MAIGKEPILEPKGERNLIEDPKKAFEMAEIENIYRTMASNTRREGFNKLAEIFEKKAVEEGEKVGEQWEERKNKVEEKLKEIITEIITSLNDILKEEREGMDSNINSRVIILPTEAIIGNIFSEFLNALKKILGVESNPYRTDPVTLSKCDPYYNLFHRTNLPRVIFRQSWDNNTPIILVCNSSDWEREKEFQEMAERKGKGEKKEENKK